MNTRRPGQIVLCVASLLLAAASLPPPDQAVANAVTTIAALHGKLGRAYAPLMQHAKAVLIAPNPRGPAVLLLHNRIGWSEPAFFDPTALHATGRTILFIMSDRALDALLRQHGLPLDGPQPLTIATIGQPLGAELLLWSGSGKPRLDEAGPQEDAASNQAWYGHARGAAEIVGFTPPSLRTSKLRNALQN